MTVIYLKVA